MASIFRDAANSMEGLETPSRNSTSHDNKFRVPISHARTTPFGHKKYQFDGNSDAENSPGLGFSRKHPRKTPILPDTANDPGLPYLLPIKTKPIKHGSASNELQRHGHKRQVSPPTTSMSNLDVGPSGIQYPHLTKTNPRVARSSTSSLASDCHSSHGVPLVIPLPDRSEEKMNSINTWLTEVVPPWTSSLSKNITEGYRVQSERKKRTNVYPNLPPNSFSVQPLRVQSPSSKPMKPIKPLSFSNKENAPPSQSLPSSCLSPSHPSALMQSSTSVKLSPSELYSTALSPSPLSPLKYPPRRMKKAPAFNHAASKVPSAPSTPFTIHEDDRGLEIKPLSPNVELFRKGRSPRRERCASYWDDDLCDYSGVEVRKGRKVLGVSERSEEWTRERPFVDQAEGATFGFRARVAGGSWMDTSKGREGESAREVRNEEGKGEGRENGYY